MVIAANNFAYLIWFQKLQKSLEFLEVQEEYIKDEQRNLKKEYLHAQEEVKRIQSVPLVIGQFLEAVDQVICKEFFVKLLRCIFIMQKFAYISIMISK